MKSRLFVAALCAFVAASGCATAAHEARDTKDTNPAATVEGPDEPTPAVTAKPPPSPEPVPFKPLLTPAPMTVVLQPVANKPIVSLRLVFRAGAVDDPPGKEGLTALTTQLMSEGGTTALSSSELLQALFPIAGELSAMSDEEFTVFSGRIHKENLEPFFGIFTDVLLKPRWDPKEFERLRADALNNVKTDLRSQSDEHLGKVMLDALVYEGHPYAHYNVGTVAGLSALTLDDVKAHAAKIFTQDRLVIGLAGAADQQLADRLKQTLSALPKTGAPPKTLPPAPGFKGRTLIVQKEGLSTAVSMGYAWPLRRGDKDYFKVAVALSHLGEHRQFNGVLFQELREKRGLNYGNYAYVEHFHQEGWGTFPMVNVGRSAQDFSIWIRPVEPQNAMFATRAALWFMNDLAQNGMPKERFEVNRGFLTGYTRLWEQTDQRRLGYAIDALFYGTPDFLENYRKALSTMTLEQVNEAAKRHLSREKMNFVFVAKDAAELQRLLTSQPPTPMQYSSSKAPDVLELDKQLIQAPVPTHPALIKVVPASSVMEK